MKIEKLSDIFGGKVPGVNQPLKFDDVSEPTQEQDPRSRIEKLPEFNLGGLSLGMNSSLKMSDLKFDSNMEKKIMGNVTKSKSKSDFNFTGFKNALPNLKFNSNMNQKIFGNTEKVAVKRMKKQKGMSLFGDWDKDKVPNIFDCDPRNLKKQAAIHDELGIENIGPENPVEEVLENVSDEQPQTYLQEGIGELKAGLKSAPGKIWTGIAQPFRDARADRDYQEQLRQAAKEQVLKKLKSGELSGTKFLSGQQVGPLAKGYKDVRGAISQGTGQLNYLGQGGALTSESQRMSQLLGLGGREFTNTQMASLGPQIYSPVPGGAPVGQPQYTQSGVPQQPQQVGSAVPTKPQPKPGMVWSEASNDWVNYTRGKYGKKKQLGYSPPPQPQVTRPY